MFTMKVVKEQLEQAAQRQVVDGPSLETFKVRLDRALHSLVWLKKSLPTAEGLDYRIFGGPLQPNLFYVYHSVLNYFITIKKSQQISKVKILRFKTLNMVQEQFICKSIQKNTISICDKTHLQ